MVERYILAAIGSCVSAAMIRVFATALSLIQSDAALGQIVQVGATQLIALSGYDFTMVVAVGSLGGVVSFFKERQGGEISRVRVFTAIGHILTAQFAAVIVYLVCVDNGVGQAIAWALCGLAGWGGNRTIETLSTFVSKRLGIGTSP